jgi:hypothetical protein
MTQHEVDNLNRNVADELRARQERADAKAKEAEAKAHPVCHSIDEMKGAAPAGAKFTTLNAGQFHALVGAYVVLPPPSGLPDADGAILAQMKGKGALVIWTKGGGTKPLCLAEMDPMQIADKFVAILKQINPGQGETVDAADGEGDLKL